MRAHAPTHRELRRTRELADRLSDVAAALAACEQRRTGLEKARTPVRAPFAAIDAIAAAVSMPFDRGSAVERDLFADCLVSIESRALIHLFFAEREAAKVAGVAKGAAVRSIIRAAVVGAGTMGGGIAMTYANAGIPVVLKDVDEAALARGIETIRRNYQASVSKGRMTPDAFDRAMALITPATGYDDFGQVDIVVEAVFEDLALKIATFADLGRVTRADCLLASNTSTLDIDRLADASGRPGSVVGHHFFSPANVMKLVEIVRGKDTSAETIATSQRLAKRLGKVGVVVGNCFGFVANRMLLQYLREAYLLLEEGASVAQIDRRHDGVRHARRPIRNGRHRGHRRGGAHPSVPCHQRRGRRLAGFGRRQSPRRDGTLRTENRRWLVSLRARQPNTSRGSADRDPGGRCRRAPGRRRAATSWTRKSCSG